MKANTKCFPTTIQATVLEEQQPTEILIQLFTDKIFVLVSQRYGKIGSFLQCIPEHSIIDNSKTYHITTLLGKRDDSNSEVYARQITEQIDSLRKSDLEVACPPILLGLGLKKTDHHDVDMFRTIVTKVINLYREAVHKAAKS